MPLCLGPTEKQRLTVAPHALAPTVVESDDAFSEYLLAIYGVAMPLK